MPSGCEEHPAILSSIADKPESQSNLECMSTFYSLKKRDSIGAEFLAADPKG